MNVESPTMPTLVWSASTQTERLARTSARLVSASTRFGVVRPALAVDAVGAEEEPVDVQPLQRGDRDRADQGVRRRAHAAGQHDHVAAAPESWSSCATGTEFVTTVRRGTLRMARANS